MAAPLRHGRKVALSSSRVQTRSEHHRKDSTDARHAGMKKPPSLLAPSRDWAVKAAAWSRLESNQPPPGFQSGVLPTELQDHVDGQWHRGFNLCCWVHITTLGFEPRPPQWSLSRKPCSRLPTLTPTILCNARQSVIVVMTPPDWHKLHSVALQGIEPCPSV